MAAKTNVHTFSVSSSSSANVNIIFTFQMRLLKVGWVVNRQCVGLLDLHGYLIYLEALKVKCGFQRNLLNYILKVMPQLVMIFLTLATE